MSEKFFLVDEVYKEYFYIRSAGKTRADGIAFILEKYTMELQDEDERFAVLIGLSIALCQRDEMTVEIAEQTLGEIQAVKQNYILNDDTQKMFKKVEQCLKEKTAYGSEAHYKKTSKYVPNWKIGDLFVHQIKHPASEMLGIKDWYILMYKVGEHIDSLGKHRQLMYISLYPLDNIQTCFDNVLQIKFLPMILAGNGTEYMAQIIITGKKDEEGYELSKIGNYPNLLLPNDCTEESPLTAMPLWGRLRPDDQYPGYEKQICRIYGAHLKRQKQNKNNT